jgi:hypothetical protein
LEARICNQDGCYGIRDAGKILITSVFRRREKSTRRRPITTANDVVCSANAVLREIAPSFASQPLQVSLCKSAPP